jgi:hypothetical protein
MGKNYKNYNSNDEFAKDMEAPIAEEVKEEVEVKPVEEVKPAPAPAPKKEKKAEPKKVSGGPARI